MDKSDEIVTFPIYPDVESLFFQPQRSSTIKVDKSINEKVQEHVDRYDEYLPRAQRGLTLYGREKEERSDKFGAAGLVNFIPAVAYHFCLNLPAAFTKPGALTLADLCTY